MGQPEATMAKSSPAHAADPGGRLTRLPRPSLASLAWRNWPVSWRLTAVVVIAVILDGVLGGLRLAAAADSTAQFGRVSQLAVLGQQVTGLAHAMEDERDLTAGFIAAGRRRRSSRRSGRNTPRPTPRRRTSSQRPTESAPPSRRAPGPR